MNSMAKRREPAKNKKEPKLDFSASEVLYTNHVSILKASQEEVEFALSIQGVEEDRVVVSQRVIVTLPHFFRIAELFTRVADEISTQLNDKPESHETN